MTFMKKYGTKDIIKIYYIYSSSKGARCIYFLEYIIRSAPTERVLVMTQAVETLQRDVSSRYTYRAIDYFREDQSMGRDHGGC